MKNLLTAIYTHHKTETDSALYGDIGLQFYLSKAAQGITGKYLVVYPLSNTPNFQLGSGRLEETTVQFSIFSNNLTSATDVLTTAGYAKTLFDDCTLTVSGQTHYRFERGFESLETDPEDGSYYYIIHYRVTCGV